jgi:phytoene synthase
VDALRRRLDAVYAGAPRNGAIDRALADTVDRFGLPRAPFDALLEGLEWDAGGKPCRTQSDLYAYAARVAGSVGAMMAVLMGAQAPMLVARACDLGVAMQLTNIARDVGEDARAGRLYLPHDWLEAAGVDRIAFMAAPRFTPALASVVARLLQEAETLYRRADHGVAALAPAYRGAIAAARLLYAEIGAEVLRRGGDSVSRRCAVSAPRKLALLAKAYVARAKPVQHVLAAPALAETQFLVDAIAGRAPPAVSGEAIAGASWAIALFAALEARPRRVA